MIVWAAAMLGGCGDDGTMNKVQSYKRSFTGAFVGGSEAGALTLLVTRNGSSWSATHPRLAEPMRPRTALGTAPIPPGWLSGTATFDGVSTYPVDGTFDPDTDSLEFTVNGYVFTGRYDPNGSPTPRVSGQMVVPHAGWFDCYLVPDSTVAVYCGQYRNTANLGGVTGSIGFVTSGAHLLGSLSSPVNTRIEGTIGNGDPFRDITAASYGILDSIAVFGSVDASVDTAGGSWSSIPFNPGIGSGTWHATRYAPAGIQVARRPP
jgi:hypothetical protein